MGKNEKKNSGDPNNGPPNSETFEYIPDFIITGKCPEGNPLFKW